MDQPEYFKRVRRKATERWDQLESDPELAGPWRQLFKQVQSPRHVVSELLQNADDAGATKASVEVLDGEFIFSHNGEDFDEQQFASLCRFGFSNKRTLHTIGFRGVGFKSTFSLGEEVRLVTPTLSVAFHNQRFTEPKWTESHGTTEGQTEVRVAIRNERIQQNLEQSLQEWGESPASLLFFHSIRCLQIQETEIRWKAQGLGPVEGSEWMSLSSAPDNQFLMIRSSEEEFPEDALQEIREERMAWDDENPSPPCRVEIVLGMEGRLFVVLPTGVRTELPFACNAPFIQDPARMKIKDPVLSPVNGWLLKRAGKLAADAMLAWVSRETLPIEERCQGYRLVPNVDRGDHTIEGNCATIVEESFEATTEGTEFLVTETGTLEFPGRCLAVPGELLDVWTPSEVSAGFGASNVAILSREVSETDREKLSNWEHIKVLDKTQILATLGTSRLPRPRQWYQLLHLWNYVSPEVITPWGNHLNLRIVPVQGKEVLYASDEVVRLGERRTLKADDWEFLAPYLLVLDPSWTRSLAQQRRTAETNDDGVLPNQLEAASNILRAIGLADSTDMDRIIRRVADSFFEQQSGLDLEDCVRLAHIAARLGVTVNDRFKFVTEDGKFQSVGNSPILANIHGDLDLFVDADWYQSNVLHNVYGNLTETCTDAEWRRWVQSPGSRLGTFVPVVQISTPIRGRDRLRDTLRQRGFDREPDFRYKRDSFLLDDWDFAKPHWARWSVTAEDDGFFWCRLLTRILEQPQSYWSRVATARQVAVTRHTNIVTKGGLIPGWIIRLRELPCLLDTWGQPRHPAELLRRTPETEPVIGVEPFIKAELDTETTRPLLALLGVRDKPTGPERLLDRLRALAGSRTPLVTEVLRWCHSLDQLFDRCTTEETHEIRTAFASNRLILTAQDEWASVDEVFLNSDEDDVLGAALLHPELRELAIWRKIGVQERPTADMEIEWLKGLPSSGKLTSAQARRIRRLLPVYPGRIWDETGHWLNLEGNWVPVGNLDYCLTMQSLVSWSHLFPAIKAKTADFQRLSAEICQRYPFSSLPRLGEVIEEHFQEQFGLPNPQVKPWVVALGSGLRRVVLDDAEQMEQVRELAHRLELTLWQVAGSMESLPYIDGKPAGTSRSIDAHWQANVLYVQNGSPAKMAKSVTQEIGRLFGSPEIAEAIKFCYERPAEFIAEHLADCFNLAAVEEVQLESSQQFDEVTENGYVADHTLPGPVDRQFGTGSEDSDDQARVEQGVDEPTAIRPGGGVSPTVITQRKPTQQSLIERFAKALNFSGNGNDKFYHADGRWLERTHGNVFPWELRSSEGGLVQYYWPTEHCIQQEPLQLGADIWGLCERFPDLYSLILTDPNRVAVEVSGSLLVKMREREELVLHPATYRLVYASRDGQGSE